MKLLEFTLLLIGWAWTSQGALHLEHLSSLQSRTKTHLTEAKGSGGSTQYFIEIAGLDQEFQTQNFSILYTLSGTHAISNEDIDNNGVLDYLENWGQALEIAWSYYIDSLGYPPPRHPNDKYTVLLKNLDEGYYGYVDIYGNPGDHPQTTQVESNSYRNYMALRNHYTAEYGPIEQVMRVTAVHEFFHTIQISLEINHELWMMEGVATMMESLRWPEYQDNHQYLESVFDHSGVGLDYAGFASQWLNRIYGLWVFWDYLRLRADDSLIKKLTLASPLEDDTWELLLNTLDEDGYSLQDLWMDFGLAYALNYRVDEIWSSAAALQGDYFYQHQSYLSGQGVWDSKSQGDGVLMGHGVHYFSLAPGHRMKFNSVSSDSVYFVVVEDLPTGFIAGEVIQNNLLTPGLELINESLEPYLVALFHWDDVAQRASYQFEWSVIPVPPLDEVLSFKQFRGEVRLTSNQTLNHLSYQWLDTRGVILEEGMYNFSQDQERIFEVPTQGAGQYWLKIKHAHQEHAYQVLSFESF